MQTITRLARRLPLLGRWFGNQSQAFPVLERPAAVIRSGPSLIAHNLTRTFGTGGTCTFALREVSLELNPGELNLLMGPSGSGKSTLLAVLSALLRPNHGSVTALGKDLWKLSESALERFRLKHCSYIFQGYNLFPALTARQQLEVVLRWGEGCSLREAQKRADHVLDQLGMLHRAHLRPAALSGGEKQRVAIARALVKNPSFVFADEPTSALDWENGRQVMDLLQETAKARNATVLVVTHDHRLENYADRIFQMADGSLLTTSASNTDAEFSLDEDTSPHASIPKSGRIELSLAECR